MSLSSIRASQRALSRLCVLRAPVVGHTRQASSNSKSESSPSQNQSNTKDSTSPSHTEPPKKHKTQAELDDELRQKMAGMAGDGGEAGVEFEDGQPVSMKRSVKNNMFRYI